LRAKFEKKIEALKRASSPPKAERNKVRGRPLFCCCRKESFAGARR
jgi:hypothetical protein